MNRDFLTTSSAAWMSSPSSVLNPWDECSRVIDRVLLFLWVGDRTACWNARWRRARPADAHCRVAVPTQDRTASHTLAMDAERIDITGASSDE